MPTRAKDTPQTANRKPQTSRALRAIVDPTLLRAIVSYGILPVVSSFAEGPNGTLLNVNADSAAACRAFQHHGVTDFPSTAQRGINAL